MENHHEDHYRETIDPWIFHIYLDRPPLPRFREHIVTILRILWYIEAQKLAVSNLVTPVSML